MHILDTNTVIYYFKNKGDVAANMLSLSPKEIGIPAVVLFELEVGIMKSTHPIKRTRQLEELVAAVSVFPFSYKEARAAAAIRVDLQKKGTPIGPFDLLIAGTALANQAILVTHNMAEFSRVSGLHVEDWY